MDRLCGGNRYREIVFEKEKTSWSGETLTMSVENGSARLSTVFIVDDDPAVCKSLRWLIESVGLPVETFDSARDFLNRKDPARPGCLVLDVRMPGMSGLELQEALVEEGCTWPVIIMSAHGDVPMAVRAMKSGAVYFFEKPVAEQMLLDHIQHALDFDREQRQKMATQQETLDRYISLTPREAEVLDLVAEGLSSKQIGQKLNVSFKTVEAHRAKITKKMQAGGVPDLVKQYLAVKPILSQSLKHS